MSSEYNAQLRKLHTHCNYPC